MRTEQIDRRVLGALRLRDAITRVDVRKPMTVTASGVKIQCNRRGDYVIFETPGYPALQAHTTEFFAPPSQPSPRTVAIRFQIRDPKGQYLPRQVQVLLPRDPQAADVSESLFQPVLVTLYSSPTASTRSTWAVVRATIRDQVNQQRLPWAMIQVSCTSGNTTPTWFQADWRGECLLAVPTIPLLVPASGTWTTAVEVTYRGRFDPQVRPLPEPAPGAPLEDLNPEYLPDPEVLQQFPEKAVTLALRAPPYTLTAGQDRSEILLANLS
jgi:hypothetical protein